MDLKLGGLGTGVENGEVAFCLTHASPIIGSEPPSSTACYRQGWLAKTVTITPTVTETAETGDLAIDTRKAFWGPGPAPIFNPSSYHLDEKVQSVD